jgi:hypothetical protein
MAEYFAQMQANSFINENCEPRLLWNHDIFKITHFPQPIEFTTTLFLSMLLQIKTVIRYAAFDTI